MDDNKVIPKLANNEIDDIIDSMAGNSRITENQPSSQQVISQKNEPAVILPHEDPRIDLINNLQQIINTHPIFNKDINLEQIADDFLSTSAMHYTSFHDNLAKIAGNNCEAFPIALKTITGLYSLYEPKVIDQWVDYGLNKQKEYFALNAEGRSKLAEFANKNQNNLFSSNLKYRLVTVPILLSVAIATGYFIPKEQSVITQDAGQQKVIVANQTYASVIKKELDQETNIRYNISMNATRECNEYALKKKKLDLFKSCSTAHFLKLGDQLKTDTDLQQKVKEDYWKTTCTYVVGRECTQKELLFLEKFYADIQNFGNQEYEKVKNQINSGENSK